MNKVLEQKLIDEAINNGDMLVQCCVTGMVKVPGTNGNQDYIKYQFKAPYENVSHGYCKTEHDKMMNEIRMMPDVRYRGK